MPLAALPLFRHLARQQDPLNGPLKQWFHSQKETLQWWQNLHPDPLCCYPRMLPVAKIRLLYLYLLFQPLLQHHHHHLLLSPLLLWHRVQPPRCHHCHLRQKLLLILLHPQTHPRPNRQLRFLAAALSARPLSTRRQLCPPCLYRLHC